MQSSPHPIEILLRGMIGYVASKRRCRDFRKEREMDRTRAAGIATQNNTKNKFLGRMSTIQELNTQSFLSFLYLIHVDHDQSALQGRNPQPLH
ncbi:hypothetical protein IEQ34_022962 [Dendrobium chrysotoxum]|uniref:Uncharacterized protein n=1 Tax=Dendrobium chrysotoxum TaxID=161865 RepID=A0AAV7G0X2_DENCH|nr:hypothetical protein IEQ34_022962 [Dendrobium chrysotoxum]